jgi:hypothetical protein
MFSGFLFIYFFRLFLFIFSSFFLFTEIMYCYLIHEGFPLCQLEMQEVFPQSP